MVIDEMDMNEREATSEVDDQPTEAGEGKSRRWMLTALRYVIALALIAFFLLRSDPREILANFATINPVWLVGALGAMAATLCVGALRWKLLLSGLGQFPAVEHRRRCRARVRAHALSSAPCRSCDISGHRAPVRLLHAGRLGGDCPCD